MSSNSNYCVKTLLFIDIFFFLVFTLRFLGERGPSNSEFGQEISKAWPIIELGFPQTIRPLVDYVH